MTIEGTFTLFCQEFEFYHCLYDFELKCSTEA